MSIITIFSASYCREDEIARRTAEQLGYACVGDEIFKDTSLPETLPFDKLVRAMHGPTSWFNSLTRERERAVALLKAAFAEYLKKGDFVYHGFAGLLLPKELQHVLRVCLVADRDYRIQVVAEEDGLTDGKKAARKVEDDDLERADWTQYLFNCGPWDKRLYDIKIPVHTLTIDDAVRMIIDGVTKINIQSASDIDQTVEDFILASKVDLLLVEEGYEVDVISNEGNVTIRSQQSAWRSKNVESKLEELAKSIPGVKNVEAHVDTPLEETPKDFDFRVHPKILLVDDEKEYVLTLSERLQVRDFPSQVVFDGEQALSYVKEEEPDVIVLDLMMPGIHGMDVLREIKKDHPKIEVIILTGHGTEKDESLARELGAFAYLQKPVDIDKLTQTMKDAYKKIENERASLGDDAQSTSQG